MKLAGKQVKMIRTHLTPMLAQRALNAYMFETLGWKAVINQSENGVCVTIPPGQHNKNEELWFVPFTNIQVVQFDLEVAKKA